MGEAKSTAELTIEDIQNQLNEEERFQLLSTNQPPKFIKGLRSCEARINEDFLFTVQGILYYFCFIFLILLRFFSLLNDQVVNETTIYYDLTLYSSSNFFSQ